MNPELGWAYRRSRRQRMSEWHRGDRSGEFFYGLGSLSRRYRLSFVGDDGTSRLRLHLASMRAVAHCSWTRPLSTSSPTPWPGWTDGGLCSMLIARGRERIKMFSWERAARTYRALYRKVAGGRLTKEDRWLLSEST